MENLGERISLLSWLRYANLDQHRSPWMRRIRENMKEEEAERESERGREREKEREMRFGYKLQSRAQCHSQALVCVSGVY